MRYGPEHNTTPLTLEQSHQSPLLNLGYQPILNSTAPYSQDNSFYHPQSAASAFPLDIRARLGASATPSAGMTQGIHRSTTLPPGTHLGSHMSTRDQYANSTPGFRRASEYTSRSPSYNSYTSGTLVRRLPISPSPTLASGFANRMDPSQYPAAAQKAAVPPMEETKDIGTLQYADGLGAIKIIVSGVIDKGFFLSEDNEWTCYRRNYFSCICSYNLTPYYPASVIQYKASPSSPPATVCGFAMCISAVVADSDQHAIDLVQHTPKRDKGPIVTPTKVPLLCKQEPQAVHSHVGGMYSSVSGVGHPRGLYPDAYGNPGQNSSPPMLAEHTFERIQFKQATQNNGKRRAAQQFYHIIVELWANVGGPQGEQYVKVAYRKSAKMIVRGRSPGHYQGERRGSQSNGPPGSSGNIGNYPPLGGPYDNGPMLASTPYGTYDTRGTVYGHPRRHALPSESLMTPEEEKVVDGAKGYQYYPGAMYDASQDHRVDLFQHHSESDPLAVKHEHEGTTLPRVMHPPVMSSDIRRCGPFEPKPSSAGYYPPHMLSLSNMGITMT